MSQKPNLTVVAENREAALALKACFDRIARMMAAIRVLTDFVGAQDENGIEADLAKKIGPKVLEFWVNMMKIYPNEQAFLTDLSSLQSLLDNCFLNPQSREMN